MPEQAPKTRPDQTPSAGALENPQARSAELPRDPRDLYLSSPRLSLRRLAKVYQGIPDCAYITLRRRHKAEGWDQLRAQRERKVSARAEEKAVETEATRRARNLEDVGYLQNLMRMLMAEAARAIQFYTQEVPSPRVGAEKIRQVISADTLLKLCNSIERLGTMFQRSIEAVHVVAGPDADSQMEVTRAAEVVYRESMELRAEIRELVIPASEREAAHQAVEGKQQSGKVQDDTPAVPRRGGSPMVPLPPPRPPRIRRAPVLTDRGRRGF